MEKDSSEEDRVSSFKAVLLGALATGVNGPTWNALKTAFLMLGVCLAAMMGLAFAGDDPWLTLHVLFLVMIAVTLFVLLICMVILYELPPGVFLGFFAILDGRCSRSLIWSWTIQCFAHWSFDSQVQRFMAQTGLVSVEHQMKELDLVPDDQNQKQKLE